MSGVLIAGQLRKLQVTAFRFSGKMDPVDVLTNAMLCVQRGSKDSMINISVSTQNKSTNTYRGIG